MDILLETTGLTMQELTNFVIVAVILLVALGVLRLVAKMAKSMIRLGCVMVLVIVLGLFLLNVLN
jgi:hypothetical protein